MTGGDPFDLAVELLQHQVAPIQDLQQRFKMRVRRAQFGNGSSLGGDAVFALEILREAVCLFSSRRSNASIRAAKENAIANATDRVTRRG